MHREHSAQEYHLLSGSSVLLAVDTCVADAEFFECMKDADQAYSRFVQQ